MPAWNEKFIQIANIYQHLLLLVRSPSALVAAPRNLRSCSYLSIFHWLGCTGLAGVCGVLEICIGMPQLAPIWYTRCTWRAQRNEKKKQLFEPLLTINLIVDFLIVVGGLWFVARKHTMHTDLIHRNTSRTIAVFNLIKCAVLRSRHVSSAH